MDKISKTEKKRHALSAQSLGEKLVTLSGEQLGRIGLPEEVVNAVIQAKTIKKHGALNRQMQYIGVLMRKTDIGPIQRAVQDLEAGNRGQAALHRQLEQWRDELLRGNDAVIEDIVRALPGAGREQLTDLVAKARSELTKTRPSPAPSRALFRHLYKSAQQS